jgi:hypothetical protein
MVFQSKIQKLAICVRNVPKGGHMDFSGPEPADFTNVQSLNYAFLSCLRKSTSGVAIRQQFVPALRPVIEGLTDLHIRRLCATPFLLFSLRERDDAYWSFLFDDDPNGDLFKLATPVDEIGQIVAAGLGFMWQLARRNPYAARLVSGATLNWCEQLAECTLLGVLQRTAGRDDLLRARLADNDEFWGKLLRAGLSSEQDVRAAAHLAALHTLLTQNSADAYAPVRAAACSIPAPSLRVAEKPNRSRSSNNPED